ncbi:hypothetical protein ZHAS_00010518 [Anopheles sinensis]|uniref:Uncharacterized protein n=1 Tax=Anopheles sinensis TaxID=74873 RepID=A0A084VXS8_ANOSI|nr:hypothetical protein ZHAS_00010518 [Anopheles sinensis]
MFDQVVYTTMLYNVSTRPSAGWNRTPEQKKGYDVCEGRQMPTLLVISRQEARAILAGYT